MQTQTREKFAQYKQRTDPQVLNVFKKRGFLNANVNISTYPVIDSVQSNEVNMRLAIDKGNKVKIKEGMILSNEPGFYKKNN